MLLHVAHELFWHFAEHLLSKITLSYRLLELHKLDDISFSALHLVGVTIKQLHVVKVVFAYTHYDHRTGQLGKLCDFFLCFLHVMDRAICDDQKHTILLLVSSLLQVGLVSFKDWPEVCRTR